MERSSTQNVWALMLATLYSGYNSQLCLKNWQIQGSKFLHTWGCLVDFLSTQTKSGQFLHCRTTMWQPGMNFSPPLIPQFLLSDKSSCLNFKEIPERHSCCYISRTPASTNQENGFQVQIASTHLPPWFKICWLLQALIWRWTIGGTGG